MRERVSVPEIFGLLPLRDRLRDTWLTLRGDATTPPSKFGPSSLKIFRPWQALQLWAGRWPVPRRAVMYNLFNHTPTPTHEGWSVRKTQVQDFRGKELTYNSHNGTDFAIPLGTPVVAPAPGRVGLVVSEFNRGGLKVVVDHGQGLVTCYAHLARALVRIGDEVERGQPIALSGMSGLNGFLFFPFESPHLHFNVWFNGLATDPFQAGEGRTLWTQVPPVPNPATSKESVPESDWDISQVDRAVEACRHPQRRQMLAGIEDPGRRAIAVMHEMNYYPTRFAAPVHLYRARHKPGPRLDLPFSKEDMDGVFFPDE